MCDNLLRSTPNSLLADAKIIFDKIASLSPQDFSYHDVTLMAQSWLDRFDWLMRQDSLTPTCPDERAD